MKRIKPTWFDFMIYRLFYWRWGRILAHDEGYLKLFEMHVHGWKAQQERKKN